MIYQSLIGKRKVSLHKRLSLLSGALALMWAPSWAWAQAPKARDYTVTRQGVAVPRLVLPPQAVTVPRVVTLSASAGLVLGQIVAGTMTMQAAWEQKLLSRDDLLQLLRRQQLSGVPQERQSEVRLGLARLLTGTLAQGEEGLQEAAGWNSQVRLSLADYYRSVRDERAVPLYQGLLHELDVQIKKSGLLREKLVDPLAHLALFYSETGDPLKAIQLWEQAEKYSREPEWLAEASFWAAREYIQVGQMQKAHQLYAQAARSSSRLVASAAIIQGLGKELQRDPKQVETQLLQIEKESRVPDARFAAQIVLAWARYKAQDWKGFLLRAEQVLKDCEQIEDKSRRQALAPLALNLEEAQRWARLWPTRSVVAENPALHLMFDGPLLQPIERRIFVNTPTLTQLQVAVEGDKERVQARLEDSPWAPELQDTRYQRIVVVTITPGVPQVQASIQISQVSQPSQVERINVVVTPQVKEGTSSN